MHARRHLHGEERNSLQQPLSQRWREPVCLDNRDTEAAVSALIHRLLCWQVDVFYFVLCRTVISPLFWWGKKRLFKVTKTLFGARLLKRRKCPRKQLWCVFFFCLFASRPRVRWDDQYLPLTCHVERKRERAAARGQWAWHDEWKHDLPQAPHVS